MKIILLTLLVLYALAMLGASLHSRRPGLAWLTGLNVFCALSLLITSLLNGHYLLGRIQASHLLIRGTLSLILWLACWFS